MSYLESRPPQGGEPLPSLLITRDVIGLDGDFYDKMIQQIEADRELEPEEVELNLGNDSYVAIIDPVEVLNLHRAVGRTVSVSAIDELAKYLTAEWPAGFNEAAPLTINPFEEVRVQGPRKKPQRSQAEAAVTTFRSKPDGRLRLERREAKRLLYQFFETDKSEINTRKVWDYSDAGRLVIASANKVSNILALRRLLVASELLPTRVILAKAFIEDDAYQG
jgi:hypothetical protein